MNRGYIKFWRKAQDSASWNRGLMYQGLIINLLSRAAWKKTSYQGRDILPGQFGAVMSHLAESLGVPRSTLQRMVAHLEADDFLKVENVGNRFCVITIVNWHIYQDSEKDDRAADGQPTVNQRAADGQPSYNEEEVKKEENKNTASASPAAEPAPASSPDGGEGKPASANPKPMPANKSRGTRAKAAPPPDEPHYQAKSGRYLTGKRLAAFLRFWACFAFTRGKAEAADAWLDIPLLTDALVEHICHAAQCEARERAVIEAKGGTPKWAQGWLNARRWEDYPPPGAQTRAGAGTSVGPGTAGDMVPAYELPELTPEQQEAARKRREQIILERAQKRGAVPMPQMHAPLEKQA